MTFPEINDFGSSNRMTVYIMQPMPKLIIVDI